MIIEGDLLHLRSGKDSFISRYVHLTLTSKILSHISSSVSNTGPTVGLIPALDTKISKPPKFFLSSAFPTWQTVPATCKPSDLSSSTALFTFASLRLLIITLAPSCAKRLAMEKPILTSIPLRTCPKTTCFPSSQSVLAVHKKNCDPFVFGPELAIDRVPGPVCFNSKFSSSNLLP
ncbi:hypothetical protein ALC56_14196 [Trachymyrmex septentrionalis]|uniref:Uncharacterized protein n=1 Tax=Trachymyrmex septentrionalis TaxID=34720 RepID=A0A195EST7_9HYME|nr:hypothetical protein ALC56_14196 [Trachymyrmex septentrionalis]